MSSTVLAKHNNLPVNQEKSKIPSSYPVEYQPQLLEEVVLRAIIGHVDEKIFREERNSIYNLSDQETREDKFQIFHQHWFESLGLGRPLEKILAYWPILKTNTSKCLLVKANKKTETGAELFVSEDDSGKIAGKIQSIVLQLTPDLVIDQEQFLGFLRHELFHVVDIVDPEFGYEPHLPRSNISPTYDRLLQDRYRVLWDISIDGRLLSYNLLPDSMTGKHWQIFKNVFQGPVKDLEKMFKIFFTNAKPKHQELVSFSFSPETWFSSAGVESKSKGICPLCHLPSFELVAAKTLSADIIQKINAENKNWNSTKPVCQQCVYLYEFRGLTTGTV